MAPQPRTHTGWIEVITGSMFSGKSEELIRRVRRAEIARQRVQLFKPRIDDRYAAGEIVSHSDMKMPSEVVSRAAEILGRIAAGTAVVGIDEGQFFDAGLLQVANDLADRGLRVIVAGLDQDYMGRPFEPMPQLMAVAALHQEAPQLELGQRHVAQRLGAVRGSVEPAAHHWNRVHAGHPTTLGSNSRAGPGGRSARSSAC